MASKSLPLMLNNTNATLSFLGISLCKYLCWTALIKNMLYEVLAAKPEMPDIFKCAPSGPNKKSELRKTGSLILSFASYISIYPHANGFFTSSRPNAFCTSFSSPKLTSLPSSTGVYISLVLPITLAFTKFSPTLCVLVLYDTSPKSLEM